MDIIVIGILVFSLLAFAFYISRKVSEMQNNKLSNDLLEYLRTTNNRLDRQEATFNERIDSATRVIALVQKDLGAMNEIGRSMKDLQDFLQSPKLRGNIGEQVLNEILKENLPQSSFHLQYAFSGGQKVDVAIKTSAGIVPVDSKFPMENFRRMMKDPTSPEGVRGAADFEKDVKKHIDDISKKYINPSEGTVDYALMYLPSEATYYEVVNNQILFEYSNKMRVLPVSPTTFYAYMKAILMSFEGQKINEKAKEILFALKGLQKDYKKVEEDLGVLQKHLNSAYNKMSDVFNSFGRLGGKITATKTLSDEGKQRTTSSD